MIQPKLGLRVLQPVKTEILAGRQPNKTPAIGQENRPGQPRWSRLYAEHRLGLVECSL